LGKNGLSGLCLSNLFLNVRLQKLDLSWNRFNHEQFTQMGVLIEATEIEELGVDYCAAYVIGRDSPVAELLEGLARDKSLKKLSLVANRVDFRAALVIEDALDMHPTLKESQWTCNAPTPFGEGGGLMEHGPRRLLGTQLRPAERNQDLNMTDNPLGALGMRSLLRLLSRQQNALKHFQSDGCYQGISGMADEDAEGCSVYSFTNPGSKCFGCLRYVLDLSRPYHRSLLRILYKTAERCKMPLDKAFEILEATPPFQHASKANGLWQVPISGRLVCNFSVEAQIQASLSGIEDDDFLGFLDTHFELTRFKADRKKIPALFAKWLELDGREEDQNVYLAALAKDFNMSLPYLSYLCRSSPSSIRRTMKTMFPTVPSDSQWPGQAGSGFPHCRSRYLAMLCLPTLADFYTCYPRMEALLTFNAQNPTGHYSLDLSNSCEFAVAQRLLLLDRWEAVCNKRRQRVDTSAMGNKSQLRNESHRGRPLHLRVRSVAEWSLPEYGIFDLDYVSCYRPPAKASPLSDGLWESLMVAMYNCKEYRPQDKLKALRSISHLIFITCMHMRQMVGYFQESEFREEAFVTFFPRVVDMHNSKQFTVRFDRQEELQRLRNRLGFVTSFPFLQPVLNLKYNDQRLCCALLVDLAIKEKFGAIRVADVSMFQVHVVSGNIREYSYITEEGLVDPLTMGVPRSWGDPAKTPSSGTFTCKYAAQVCAPEDRQVDFRKKLAQTYGFINTTFNDADIAWWTGISVEPFVKLEGVELRRTSSLYSTTAQYVSDQPAFLNAVVELQLSSARLEDLQGLLSDFKVIEEELGRTKGLRRGPRVIDLDLVAVGQRSLNITTGKYPLQLPHALMHERDFVLVPFAELSPAWTHPTLVGSPSVRDLLERLQSGAAAVRPEGASLDSWPVQMLPGAAGLGARVSSPGVLWRRGEQTLIMGILNVTPDSFSDGGDHLELQDAVQAAKDMIQAGAQILDIGGESTRPGASEVPLDEELKRVVPVIQGIREAGLEATISIDTRKASVARKALEAGADWINDVSGGEFDPQMLTVASEFLAPIVLMHMKGTPETMNSLATYSEAVVTEVGDYLLTRRRAAEAAGVPSWNIILDPGIGFAKTLEHNLSLLRHCGELVAKTQPSPLLVGASRKRFIGTILQEPDFKKRSFGNAAATAIAIAGLNEVGEDVLDLLEFFISRYNHVNEAFHHIDGGVREGEGGNTTSNGELTLREFEAGLRDIGCHKFRGPNEKERIGAVFRYLDPGGEGNVSLQEWQILDQLWKEFVLSIQEFVQFLIYAFGDELEFAWEELDDDGSGELSEDEWFGAVKRIGYFGPARVVFALLDGSDDGNISWDEFSELEK
ncbi:unnamed protein product, partial [Durusdinium trenchii]